MNLILNIDTALETASVSLANNGEVIMSNSNGQQKDHAAWLHPAVNDLLKETGFTVGDLAAIAISNGPGSYTGLRVGLAAAKGYCYALNKPLITVGTLEIMAWSVKEQATDLICPLIDARRMEAYVAVYDKMVVEKIPPHVEILNENSFSIFLETSAILFCGSGIKKIPSLFRHPEAHLAEMGTTVPAFAQLSSNRFIGKKFADVAYTEPLYIKEFFTPLRSN
ncbi:MAG TPA: tRNA (adenosine(37)-N6)-threonylcarbamoyltransferase complex dimerization subunit type 1 TsaB [Chitinophagaceae bacterium]|nr:tRNA (adenosine(37)-N6)-threonylcarbamoyltransferase complex dimerization subunit type 1 TsaB [Chitinophagaceae bacterium]